MAHTALMIEVGLLSGRKVSLKAAPDESIEALLGLAQRELAVGRGRLLDSSGCFLDRAATLVDSGVQSGDTLTLQISGAEVHRSIAAFVAILGDGSVASWGRADAGGDSSAVQHQLKHVRQIQAANGAFAAILGDGSVVTWGSAPAGGNSSAVQHQLKDVRQIQAANGAFAAILGDGSVVTWGRADSGGDSRAVQHQLKHVSRIQAANIGAFAAILGDGSVVTWGRADAGGDSSAVQH